MSKIENSRQGDRENKEDAEKALLYHEKLLVIRDLIKRIDEMENAHPCIVDSPAYIEIRYRISDLRDGDYEYDCLRDLYCSFVSFLRVVVYNQPSRADVPSNGLRVVQPGEVRPPIDYFHPTFYAHYEYVKEFFLSDGPENSIRREVMSAALSILMGETPHGPEKVWPNPEKKNGYEECVRERIEDILAETNLSFHLELFPYPEDKTNIICRFAKLSDEKLEALENSKHSTDLERKTAYVILNFRKLVKIEQEGKKKVFNYPRALMKKLEREDPGKLIFKKDWEVIAGDSNTRRALASNVLPILIPGE